MEKGIMYGLDPGQFRTSTFRQVGKVLGKKLLSLYFKRHIVKSGLQLTLKDSCVRMAFRGERYKRR